MNPLIRLTFMTLLAVTLAAPGVWSQPAPEDSAPDISVGAADRLADAVDAEAVDLPPANVVPGSKVAIIRIEGDIYDFTLTSLQRRVDRALAQGAEVIVLELNTNGGLATAAVDISLYIKRLPVPTVAWINPKAYSAGIIIAAACDSIAMSRASVTGDAAPISLGGALPETERAKALSPILEDFYHSANDNGYSYAVLKATCTLNVEVYRVRHNATGEEKLVHQADYQMMVQGLTREEAVAAVTPASGLPPVSPDVAAEVDRGQWVLVKQMHDGRTLLTLSEDRARDFGLSKATVTTQAELEQWLGTSRVIHIGQSWSESLAGWLLSPWIRGALIGLFLLGLYMEMQTPGLGFAGAVAGVCLIILLGAPFLVGLSQVWHLVLFFLGLGLLISEVTFTPGFGALGIAGIVAMLAALVIAPIPAGEGFLPAREMHPMLVQYAVISILGVMVGVAGIVAMFHYFGHAPMFNRFIHTERQRAGVGVLGAGAVSGSEVVALDRVKVGETARVVSPLRPLGRIEVQGRIVDAASQGQWVDAGTTVRVLEVQPLQVIVEPV